MGIKLNNDHEDYDEDYVYNGRRLKSGLPSGKGSCYFPNGDYYRGEWK